MNPLKLFALIAACHISLLMAHALYVLWKVARLRCLYCKHRYGWHAAMHHTIVFRVLHASFEKGASWWEQSLTALHTRKIHCSHCGEVSYMDLYGHDHSSIMEVDGPNDR